MTEIEGNKSNEVISKLIATQNVLKNKFRNAHANRIEHENNINQSLNPLQINESKSTVESDSLRNLSKTNKNTQQFRLAAKSYSNHANVIKSQPMTIVASTATTKSQSHESENVRKKPEKSNCVHLLDPNELCDRLRSLLTTPITIADNANRVEEINAIIAQLRDLDILV